jgi:DNA-binding transcriptional MerR regulator
MNTGNDNNKYYTIGEVSDKTGIKTTVLRFWESEFEELSPVKNKFGHRVYKDSDIEIILKIKFFLYEKGMTIKGVKDLLNSNAVDDKFNARMIRKKIEECLKLLKGNF